MKNNLHNRGSYPVIAERRLAHFAMNEKEIAARLDNLENENKALRKEVVDLRNINKESSQRIAALQNMQNKYPNFRMMAQRNRLAPNSAYERNVMEQTHEQHRMNSYFNRVTRRTMSRYPGYEPQARMMQPYRRSNKRIQYSKEKGLYWETFTGKGPDQGWEDAGKIVRSEDDIRAHGRAATLRFEEDYARRNAPPSRREKYLLKHLHDPIFRARSETYARARAVMGDAFFDDLPRTPLSETDVRFGLALATPHENVQLRGNRYAVLSDRAPQIKRLEGKTSRDFASIPYDYDKYLIIDQRFSNIGDDVKRIQKYHDELRAEWPDLPLDERRYRISRLKTLRDRLKNIFRQQERMKKQRERLQYRDVLRTVEVPVQDATEPVRVTLPEGFASFDGGKVREIWYYPFNSSFRRSDAAAADQAGIIFENEFAGYKDGLGREAVRGVYVHFKTQGLFKVNDTQYNVQPAIKKQPLNPESTKPWDTRRRPITYPQD